MAYDKRRGAGGFYRLDPDGTVEQLLDRHHDLERPRPGRPDGRTLYYIDTPTRQIDAFDYDLATGSAERAADAHHARPTASRATSTG